MRERLTLNARDQQRIDVLARWRDGALTVAEAAALLGTSVRTAWRLLRRFRTVGVDGIVHGNRGRASPRRLAATTRERIVELARTRYRGVNDSHLAELLAEDEGIVIGRSSLQRLLRRSGVGTTRRRRSPRYRSRRERMPQAGLLVQIDGSPHDWLEGRGPRLTLVGAIDDATGTLVAATFCEAEDGRAYLTILAAMCRDHGIPAAIYRDRSGIFAPLRPGGRLGDAGTQVGRAFAELGISSIPAASAQAKGRVERLWGTCQDRLVSELRLAGRRPRHGQRRARAVHRAVQRQVQRPGRTRPAGLASGAPGSRARPDLRLPLVARRRQRQHGPGRGRRSPAAAHDRRPGCRRPAGRGRAPARRPAARRRSRANPLGPAGLARPARAAGDQARGPDRSGTGTRWCPATRLSAATGPSLESSGANGTEPRRTDRITEQLS